MYKVSEVAKICSVSTSAVYRILRDEKDACEAVVNPLTSLVNGKMHVTEEGLAYFKQRFNADPLPVFDTKTSELIQSLTRQLEEKDRQIEHANQQISQLMEQNRNSQILLRAEQEKTALLLQPRQNFLKRLFGKKEIPDPDAAE